MIYRLLTSQYTMADLKICLINLLYGVMADFNHQQTIINLYWNYLLQEAKTFTYPTEALPLTSTSLTELPKSITISLRWQDEATLHIRGNINQMTLDIL